MLKESQDASKENIELCLPVNAAYVSAARLTASSIANRLGFEIDEIEDIKAAVSEACTFIIKKTGQNDRSMFKIVFEMQDNVILIKLSSPHSVDFEKMEEEMSLLMIKALTDSMNATNEPDGFLIEIKKIHKKISFE